MSGREWERESERARLVEREGETDREQEREGEWGRGWKGKRGREREGKRER